MKRTTVLALLAALALPAFALSEKETLLKHWKTTADFTLAVAEAMPEASYNAAPNEEEMGFGKLMIHIAMSNNMLVQAGTGVKAPEAPQQITATYKQNGAFQKATVLQFLKTSFDYCMKAVDQVTPEQLDKVGGPEGRQASGRERLWSAFTHTAHHRGQAEVYLRVKNIKPPAYRF